MDELRELDGPEFNDIVARPTPRLQLPAYTPQPRLRRSFRGYLDEDIYFVRAGEVVKRKRITTAVEMRGMIGLRPNQKLIVLLFDDDVVIEDMWTRGARLVQELADAGYDAIVSPSFSTYTPRPHTDFLINAKRSLIYFSALQMAGAYAIPRVAWIVSHDARRFAIWAQENPSVEMVAIDLSTYRSPADWREQLEGLEIFDSITDRRITYLINGPTTKQRVQQLFEIAGPDRVRITNATTQVWIPKRPLRSAGDQTGVTFKSRVEVQHGVVAQAAQQFQQQLARLQAA